MTQASADLASQAEAKLKAEKVHIFVTTLRKALHNTFRYVLLLLLFAASVMKGQFELLCSNIVVL